MADAGRWKPYVRRQGQLLPAFVDDALDPSAPVFFIDDVVDGLELTARERRYAQRKTQGEGPFAEIEQAMGFRRCPLRGRAKGWGEWNVVATACNLRCRFALGVAPT